MTDTALGFLLQNIEDVEPEALVYLPIHVVQRLWHEMNKQSVSTFPLSLAPHPLLKILEWKSC